MDRDTGRSKGFGIVERKSEQAQAAIAALKGHYPGPEDRDALFVQTLQSRLEEQRLTLEEQRRALTQAIQQLEQLQQEKEQYEKIPTKVKKAMTLLNQANPIVREAIESIQSAAHDKRLQLVETYSGTVTQVHDDKVDVVYEGHEKNLIEQTYEQSQFLTDKTLEEDDQVFVCVFLAKIRPQRKAGKKTEIANESTDYRRRLHGETIEF
jgi:RNA recognition motif-containing protein